LAKDRGAVIRGVIDPQTWGSIRKRRDSRLGIPHHHNLHACLRSETGPSVLTPEPEEATPHWRVPAVISNRPEVSTETLQPTMGSTGQRRIQQGSTDHSIVSSPQPVIPISDQLGDRCPSLAEPNEVDRASFLGNTCDVPVESGGGGIDRNTCAGAPWIGNSSCQAVVEVSTRRRVEFHVANEISKHARSMTLSVARHEYHDGRLAERHAVARRQVVPSGEDRSQRRSAHSDAQRERQVWFGQFDWRREFSGWDRSILGSGTGISINETE
jgi:hypothetical protein